MTDPSPSGPLVLDAELGTDATVACLASLTERRGAALCLDASQVEHMGAPVAQILLSARRTWAEDELPWSVADPSDAFVRCLELLGARDEILRETPLA